MSRCDRFIKYVMTIFMPYVLIKELFTLSRISYDRVSVFNNDCGKAKRHNLCESIGFKVEDLKRASKKHSVTINDLLCAAFGTSIKEYLDQHEEKPENIPTEGGLVIPVNLRPTPKNLLEMRAAHNRNHGEVICLPLSGNFETTVARVRQQMNDFKNSHRHFMLGAYAALATHFFPTFTKSWWMSDCYNSMTVNLTNICGSEIPLKFGDALSEEIMFHSWAEDHFFNTLQMAVFSHRGQLKMSLSSSRMQVDARDIMQIMER